MATLAAHGHSNREIAQQLYVTERTVETHLTHAFQKLRIASRGELSAHLDDEPGAPVPTGSATRSRPSFAGR